MQVLKSDDGLRQEILKDAKAKAERIISKAKREREKILADIEIEIKKFKEDYTKTKTDETEKKIKLIYSTIDMEVKKTIIKYSNELIDNVFNSVFEKLKNSKVTSYEQIIAKLLKITANKIKSDDYILEVSQNELLRVSKEFLSKIDLNAGKFTQIIESDLDEGYKIFSSDRKIGAYVSLKRFLEDLQESQRVTVYKMFLK